MNARELIPEFLRSATATHAAAPKVPWYVNRSLPASDRADLYRSIAGYVRKGIPVRQILAKTRDQIAKLKPHDIHVYLCNDLMRELGRARKLSVAMGRWVPTSEQMVIRAGERQNSTEGLAAGLEQAAELATIMDRIQTLVRSKLTYPAVLTLGVIAVIYVFCFQIIPELRATTSGEWTGLAAFMLSFSNYVQAAWIWLLLGVLVAVGWVYWSLARLTGPVRSLLDNVLPWSVYRSLVGAAFLHSVGAMVRGGAPFQSAIREMQAIGDAYQGSWIDRMRFRLQKGADAVTALDCKMFDLRTRISLHVAGETENFDRLLGDLAERQLESSITRIGRAASILGFVALAMAAAMVVMGYFTVWSVTGNPGAQGGSGSFGTL